MKTKYSIVRDSIKTKILNGTYQPNQRISSESELMKEFNVSRHTVRQAIGDLVTKGWLYRVQGSGTFCADMSRDLNKRNVTRTKNIAMITTYISEYIFPTIIRGAETQLSQHDFNVSLFSTNNDHEMEKEVLEKILSQDFDGVIVEPTKSALPNPNIGYYLNLERKNIPYLMIHAYYDELEPPNIIMDDEMGGFMQTEHLLELGHENIVGFFKTDDNQGIKRMKGFLNAHRKYGVVANPNNVIVYNTAEKKTTPVEQLKKLLSKSNSDKPTAIVCYHDELAVLLLEVLREYNLNVPEDISIIGYDDSYLASVSEVKLTTVKHPQIDMGYAAAKMILELIQNRKVEPIVFTPELVVRNSTRELK
ncbi:MAG TPA: GntR family transcriptional regulator [Bacillota bacterium]|nr:GntR family transcriptional regulator [Bacillota bacterium]